MEQEVLDRLIQALSNTGATRSEVEDDISGDVTMEGLHNMATRIPAQAGLPVDALAMAMAGAGLTDMAPGEFVGSTDWIQDALGGDPGAGESVVADFVSPDPLDAVRAAGHLDKLLEAMVVFHGSPHKWDKIDLSKIGTGEGAQAYGHGFYAAEKEGVAKSYQKKLTGRGAYTIDGMPVDENVVAHQQLPLQVAANDGEKGLLEYISNYDKRIAGGEKLPLEVLDELDFAENLIGKKVERAQGHLYELDLPESTIDKMLDWDKPMSEQSESVREALQNTLDDIVNREPDYHRASEFARRFTIDKMSETLGEDLHRTLSSLLGGDEKISKLLNNQGIPGIRYLDGTSRTAGEGTRNFVLFDEDLATPLKRNGQPIVRDNPAPTRRKNLYEMASEYPMAPKRRWYGDADYKQRGGRLRNMTPDEFLANATPLKMDDETLENVADLRRHMEEGGELDPLALYGDKSSVRNSDGRHRALAAKEMGIKKVPVLDFR